MARSHAAPDQERVSTRFARHGHAERTSRRTACLLSPARVGAARIDARALRAAQRLLEDLRPAQVRRPLRPLLDLFYRRLHFLVCRCRFIRRKLLVDLFDRRAQIVAQIHQLTPLRRHRLARVHLARARRLGAEGLEVVLELVERPKLLRTDVEDLLRLAVCCPRSPLLLLLVELRDRAAEDAERVSA